MEQHLLADELNSMDQRMTQMEEKIDTIDEKVTQVVDAIIGNPLTKQGGFISEVNSLKEKIIHLEGDIKKLEDRQDKYDLFKNRIIWTIGIVVAIGAIAKYVVEAYLSISK